MIYYAIAFVLLMPVMWTLYLAVMHLDTARRRGTLTTASKVVGYPILFIGLAFDVMFNAVWGSLLFLEPPREWLFTDRVSRWNDDEKWRGAVARWICDELLDPFDPRGQHCR